MPAGLQFVVEAACLGGLAPLAALAAWLITNRSFTLLGWLRVAIVLIVAVQSLAAFGSGSAVIFQAVIGISVFFAGLLGVALGAAYGWRWRFRNQGRDRFARLPATNFAGAVMWGVGAATCAAIAVWFVGTFMFTAGRQIGFQIGLDPKCSSDCVQSSSAVLVQNWVDNSTGAHWIQVRTGGRTQNIQVDPNATWVILSGGKKVELTSWRGTVTEVTVPGMAEMETTDGPFSTQIPGGVFFLFGAPSLLAFPIFLGGAIFYWRQCRTALRHVGSEAVAA